MPQVLQTPRARADLVEILIYIGQNNPSAADRFAGLIDQKCQLLAEFPLLGPACDELAVGLRYFTAGNYVIFYKPTELGIQVIRILHGARDLPAIFQSE